MTERKDTVLAFRVSERYLSDVDRIAKKLKLTRSQLVLNILEVGLADAKLLERMGLADLAGVVRGFQSGMYRSRQMA